jgi:glyoxylase-like metal-dependent hydrolase (beta-lactamase superfamily II)
MKTEYFCLEPQTFKLDGGAMFGIIPKPLWSKVHPSDDQNRIELALRLVIIKKDAKIILIDTGIGDYHGQKFDERFAVVGGPTPLERSLTAINLKPEDITDLVISHLHFDHVGGIGKIVDGKMEPILKNAMVHLHKKHFEYSHHPTERDAGSFHNDYFKPVLDWYQEQNLLHFVDGMEGVIFPGLNFMCSMGHTPFLLHAYDDKFIYMADLIPTSNHVNIPWVMGYDISPGITTQDKNHFLQFINEKKLTMIFEHDPLYFGSTVKKNEKGDYVCDQKLPTKNDPAYLITLQ